MNGQAIKKNHEERNNLFFFYFSAEIVLECTERKTLKIFDAVNVEFEHELHPPSDIIHSQGHVKELTVGPKADASQ